MSSRGGISASAGGIGDIELAVFDNGERLIRRYISARLGIVMASRSEMEGTDVSRLHDERESASQVSRVSKASSTM